MFDDATLRDPYPGYSYATADNQAVALAAALPTPAFYWKMFRIIFYAASLAKRGVYDDAAWTASSLGILRSMEECGARAAIEGMEHFKNLDGPCVFVGNHMSTLETFVLPSIIQPYKPVTFVVKQSLLDYPVFKHVMRARKPVAVRRKNPRDDLATVMSGGCERLNAGISIIIFPQSTRNLSLDPQQFNTMGVKLARKAGVPVIPVAIRSDCWGIGGIFGALKDYGRIRPQLPVRFAFGEPMTVRGNGKEEHAATYNFIRKKLGEWGVDAPPLT